MKIPWTIFSLLLFHFLLKAQPITLNQCYEQGRLHHPNLSKLELYNALMEAKTSVLTSKHLPKMDLSGQVTYQSDVPGVVLPSNQIGFALPEISKDWYKAYIDVQQNLYDGGAVRQNKKLEEATLQANLAEVEVSLYQVNQLINASFFSALFYKNGIASLALKQEVLEKQAERLKSAVDNGVVLPNERDNILAELLLNEQQVTQIQNKLDNSLTTLSILTGMEMDAQNELVLPKIAIDTFQANVSNRPEFQFFSAKMNQLEASKAVSSSNRLPKVFGFAQLGYGRPGLNPLDDSFTDWYVVGIGLKWNIWDWNETHRKKDIASINQQMIEAGQTEFERNQTIQLLNELNNIEQYESLINTDQKLYELRKQITERSQSQLDNGAITSADYIRDLNNAIAAKLSMESRLIELAWAKMKLLFISGINPTE